MLEAAVLLPGAGAVTGWAALRWRGAGYFDGLAQDGRTERPVALAIGPQHAMRSREGITVLRDRLDPTEVTQVRGVQVAKAERALFDQMRKSHDLTGAVVAADMAMAAELTSTGRMRSFCVAHAGWNGVPLVRAALDLADERSRSPNETRMRLIWVLLADLPWPKLNQPIFDLSGRLLGVADLFDPVAGVVGEFDGAVHRHARRHHRDVLREDSMRRVGLEYFKVVGADLRDPAAVADRMRATRARARFHPPAERRWTMQAPSGWHESPLETMSLDERLSYREWLNDVHSSAGPIDRLT